MRLSPWQGLTTHQESSLGPVPVTVPVKCRQNERQAVNEKMKLDSLVMFSPGADSVALLEGKSKRPSLVRSLETQAGFRSTARLETDVSGTREVRWLSALGLSMSDKWRVIQRKTNGPTEVGPVHITLSTGKPCTRGRDGAGYDLVRDTSSALRGGSR